MSLSKKLFDSFAVRYRAAYAKKLNAFGMFKITVWFHVSLSCWSQILKYRSFLLLLLLMFAKNYEGLKYDDLLIENEDVVKGLTRISASEQLGR